MGDDDSMGISSSSKESIPTMEYTTGRRSYKIASAAIGPDIAPRTVPKTAAGTSDQQKKAQLVAHNTSLPTTKQLIARNKSRPSSTRAQAAAYRAYGGLGSRGLERSPPGSTIMPHFNTSTSVIHSVKGCRPSSAVLGGGYHYPTSRPHSAHEKSIRRQPGYMQASFKATPDGPVLSGPKMTEAPALQRPMSAGPVPYERQVYQTNSVPDSKGPEQRFSHTLPTDPAAKRIWENLTKRPYFVPPPVTDRVPSRQSLSAPSTMHRRLPRPLSGHSVRSSERFSSMPLQQLGANTQPMIVSGYSPPEEEWAAPPPSSAWWQGSRLGRTAIQTLDTRLKMAGNAAGSIPTSDNQLTYAARGAQLSPLRPFQPPPHAESAEEGHLDAGKDDADAEGGDDGGTGNQREEGRCEGGEATGKDDADGIGGDDGSVRKQEGKVSAAGGQEEAGKGDADGNSGDSSTMKHMEEGGAGGGPDAGEDDADGDGGDDGSMREQAEEVSTTGGQEEAGKDDTDGNGGNDSSVRKHMEEEGAVGGQEAGHDDDGGDDDGERKQTQEEGAGVGIKDAGEVVAGGGDNSVRRRAEEFSTAGGQEEAGEDDNDGNGGDDEGAQKQREEVVDHEQNGICKGAQKQREEVVDHEQNGIRDSEQSVGERDSLLGYLPS